MGNLLKIKALNTVKNICVVVQTFIFFFYTFEMKAKGGTNICSDFLLFCVVESNRVINFPVKATKSYCAQLCTPCDAAAVNREKPRPSWLQRPLPSVCTLMQLTRLSLTLMQSHNFVYGLWNFLRYAIRRTTCWNSRYFYFYNFVYVCVFPSLLSSVLYFQLGCMSCLNISSVRYFIGFTYYSFPI